MTGTRPGPGYPKICGTSFGYCAERLKDDSTSWRKPHVCKLSVRAPGQKHVHVCRYCGGRR